jgi:hypothetical protein
MTMYHHSTRTTYFKIRKPQGLVLAILLFLIIYINDLEQDIDYIVICRRYEVIRVGY